jgi:serine/threonine protein kinase
MRVGDILEQRFVLSRFVSQGTDSSCWLVKEIETEEEWFCKLISLQQGGWDRVHRLEQEAEILQQLHHPSIPQFHDLFVSEALASMCLLRQWIPGHNLETALQQRRLSEEDVLSVARQLLNILMYLHGLSPRVLHLALQPDHVLLSPEGEVFVIDVKGTQDSTDWSAGVSTPQGSFGYASPEQFLGRPVPASDLYGLGATLVHLLSRQHPADLPSEEGCLRFQEFVNVSPTLLQWLETLLQPAPENRFASARLALDALNRQQKTSIPATSPSPQLRSGLRQHGQSWQWEHQPEDHREQRSAYHTAVGSRFRPLFQHLNATGLEHGLSEHMSLQEVVLQCEQQKKEWSLTPPAILLKTLHPMDAADTLFSCYEPSLLLHEYGPELAERFSLLWTRTSHNAVGQWWLLYFLQKHHWNPLPYWRQFGQQQLSFRGLTHLPSGRLRKLTISFERFQQLPLGKQAEEFERLRSFADEARRWYRTSFSITPDDLRLIVQEGVKVFELTRLQEYGSDFQEEWTKGATRSLLQQQMGRLPRWLKTLQWWHREEQVLENLGRLAGSLYSLWRELEKVRTQLLEEYHWLLEDR